MTTKIQEANENVLRQVLRWQKSWAVLYKGPTLGLEVRVCQVDLDLYNAVNELVAACSEKEPKG